MSLTIVKEIKNGGYSGHYISVDLTVNNDIRGALKEIKEYTRVRKAKIISHIVFGSSKNYNDLVKAIEYEFKKVDWPLTMVEGDSCKDDNVTGMQLYAVSGIEPKLIMTEGRIAGYLYEAGGKKYGLFGNIKPKDSRLSKKEQAKQVLELMDSTLRSADMDFSNIIRTWFYLNELLKWYKEFNEARNEFFTDHKIFEDLVPASTGIGGKPESKEALVAGMLAIKSTNGIKPAAAVVSPLQCPALNYKSSFSRAVEYSLGGVKKLIISGTASIDKDGNSVYKDDIRKQLWYTMEVVEAILKCRKMTFGDTVRAIAYFRDAVDIPVFEEYCREKKLKDFPFIISNADVCRSDLLFEIELDAVKDN